MMIEAYQLFGAVALFVVPFVLAFVVLIYRYGPWVGMPFFLLGLPAMAHYATSALISWGF